MRYWAVTGLSSYDSTPATIERLKPFLDDESISVSLAAAAYLVRTGSGSVTIAAFARGLESDILWARIRAGAYLSYCSREELQPMAPLIPALRAALDNQNLFGPEHDPHIKTNQFTGMLNAQRDVIGRQWVLERVMKRIEVAAGQEVRT